MSNSYTKATLPVAGIWVNVYKSAVSADQFADLPVAVLFVLHGRGGNRDDEDVIGVVDGVFSFFNEEAAKGKPKRGIVVVSLDHRNHGSREIDADPWGERAPKGGNDSHAVIAQVDKFAVFIGTAKDVSFLIDFLPSYLYPNDERTIDQWLVSGVSLGGHATWTVLRHEPRVSVGIPIIGCPSLTNIYRIRAERSGVPFAPPYITKHFLSTLTLLDAASAPSTTESPSNPYLNKRILVLSGANDEFLPWSAGECFIESLVVGDKGVKQVVLQPDASHECTKEMCQRLAQFVWEEALAPTAKL